MNIHPNVMAAITNRRMTLDFAPPLRIKPAILLKAVSSYGASRIVTKVKRL